MNSENSQTSRPHVLIFNLIDKIDLRKREKSIIKSQHILQMEKNKKVI